MRMFATRFSSEEVRMNRALRAVAFSLFMLAPAVANELPNASNIQVGTTVICDTQKQMERFVVVFDGDFSSAMDKVNTEENNPTACIGATMAYVQGHELSKAKGFKGTYNIIRVLVLGITTPMGFQPIQPATFFSIVKSDEVET
jgi:hypothetical protein